MRAARLSVADGGFARPLRFPRRCFCISLTSGWERHDEVVKARFADWSMLRSVADWGRCVRRARTQLRQTCFDDIVRVDSDQWKLGKLKRWKQLCGTS